MSSTGRSNVASSVQSAVAALAALAAGFALSRAVPAVPFAPAALGDRIIRATPGDVATLAIDRLGHAAQPLLELTLAAAFAGLGALLAIARLGVAAGLFAIATLAVGLLEPVQPSAPAAAAGAAVVGGTYALARWWLERASATARAPVDPERRRALAWMVATTGLLLLASEPLGRLVRRWTAARAAPLARLPVRDRAPVRPPFPSVPGLSPEVTSVRDHYVVDIDLADPVVSAVGWRLEVGGLVARPVRLGFDELQQRFALVEEISTLTCISNRVGGPLAGCSRWLGVRLRDLLHAAGPRAGATALAVRCIDGYSVGVPLAAAMHPSALVAIAQDGQPLTREHGFPCRLRLPALYGMMNPKWVQAIEVVDHAYRGYWQRQGWAQDAIVRTASRIDTPRAARVGQPTWIAGVAWAGVRGIASVEVSTDGGARWTPARLHQPLSPWAWTQWAVAWTPQRPGRHELTCRATDGSGHPQDTRVRPPHPSGASGLHRVTVDVS